MNLQELFASEPDRLTRLGFKVGLLHADFSKQRLSVAALDQALAASASLHLSIARLFSGAVVNPSEGRAALHTALRVPFAQVHSTPMTEAAFAARERMLGYTEQLRAGKLLGATGKPINTLVNVGIGGSDLGPRLLVNALRHLDPHGPRIENLNNVDGHAANALLPTLDPETTAIAYVSKSFTTVETKLNLKLLRDWLTAKLGTDAALWRHFCVVTAKPELAHALDVPAAQIFPMFDWVGGRYSVWSAVGLSVAAAIGREDFMALLAGAHEMDAHFASAPLARNLPVVAALVELDQRTRHPARAVIPYDYRLGLLPEYLQQLEMESNGKSVQLDGSPVDQATNALVFGAVGTNAQHAFFQQLHQGTDIVPVEFIGVIEPDHPFAENHRVLLANMLAQGAALMRGKTLAEVKAELIDAGLDAAQVRQLGPHRVFPGNRPSTTLLLDRLNGRALGNLLAYYEHKVYAAGALLNINSFDQWGVELGKALAAQILPALSAGADLDGHDPSTQSLIRLIRR